MFVANEVLFVNEVGGVEDSDKLIEKCGKQSKTRKLLKSLKLSKFQKLAKSGKKLSTNRNSPNFGATKAELSFLTSDARTAFNHWRLAFIKAPIFWYFDLECHIWIETDISGYAIGGVLSQLTSGTSSDKVVTKANLGWWHLVAFFSRNMILAETWYKTHNIKFLAIVEAFKTWRHYLKSYKYKVFVFIDHNNFCHFMDTKSLSSRQVYWTQKFFW